MYSFQYDLETQLSTKSAQGKISLKSGEIFPQAEIQIQIHTQNTEYRLSKKLSYL
jgi:hypothetical protein